MKTILILGHIGIGSLIVDEMRHRESINVNYIATLDDVKEIINPEPKFNANDINKLIELIPSKYIDFKEPKPKFTNKFNKNSHRRK